MVGRRTARGDGGMSQAQFDRDKDRLLAEASAVSNDHSESRRADTVGRGRWLAPAGTIMAMLTCYGITAVLSILSLIGISIAIPFRAPVIVFFSALAATGLVASYRRDRNRLVVLLGVAGFLLVTASKLLPPGLKVESIGIEGAGFLCLVGANILVLRARRRAGRACKSQYAR